MLTPNDVRPKIRSADLALHHVHKIDKLIEQNAISGWKSHVTYTMSGGAAQASIAEAIAVLYRSAGWTVSVDDGINESAFRPSGSPRVTIILPPEPERGGPGDL